MPLPRATLARSLARPHSTPSFFTPSRNLAAKRTLFSRAQKPPGWQPFYRRHPRVFAVLAAPFVVGGSLGVALLGLWAYDASTYHHPHAGRVPVDPVALKPERGGKKNLKVAAALIDDLDERVVNARDKKRLVIVGGGWGSVGILQHLDPGAWHVTVVSPDTSATVGTVEVRSLVEPLRKIIARVSGHFLYGRAVDVDFSERLLEVACPGDEENFYLPYDKLVIACGSVNSTHGVPGLENCFQLKTVQDAQAIRRRVMDNLEKAALPSTEEDERRKLLSFVICGGGPTGVEFASELWEMVNEDVISYMPGLLRDEIKVHLIQSRDHILNTYAEKISEYAEERFRRHEIDMILNARVKEVTPQKVVYTIKDPKTGKTTEHEVDSGFTLWSTGIAMNPFTQRVAALLPNQYHKHALEVDSHLRVIGAPLGTVYALGDCATIETRLVDHLLEFVTRCDENKDGKIDEREFKKMMGFIKRRFPASEKHFGKIEDIFKQYADGKGALGLNELADLFINVSRKITAFPATAQVAEQEGIYLAKKLNVLAKQHDAHVAIDNGVYDDPDDMLYEPFNYKHTMYLWRSVYLSTSVTIRQRCLLMADWVKRSLFGRDLSKIIEIVQTAIKHGPSAFNTQSSRAVVLFGSKHEKFWNTAEERFKAAVSAEFFAQISPKLLQMKDAYGLPPWSENAHGIVSYIIWTALYAEGLGASLQHYTELVQEDVEEMFQVPSTWKLRANLVFGAPTVPPMEKTFQPLEDRVKVFA
ncbi:hypothetical protein BJY59DRAFT_644410 [Rhodotorula toruloides]